MGKHKHELAFEDFKKGMKYKNIAEKYEVSLSAVKSWATRHGWKDKLQPDEKVATKNEKLQPDEKSNNNAKETAIEVKINDTLTDNQRLFCTEYLIDRNATQAAIRAGYSAKTANEQGARLLANVSVSAYIREKLDEVEKSKIATLEEILQTQTRILRRAEQEYTTVTIKSRKSSYDKQGKKVIVEKESVEIVGIPSKLSDVNQAAEQLSKRLLFNPLDKHRIEFDNNKLAFEKEKIQREDDIETIKNIDEKLSAIEKAIKDDE